MLPVDAVLALGGGILLRLPMLLALIFLATAAFNALTTNVYYSAISLRDHRFNAYLKVSGLAGVYLTNYLLVILTLGLYSAAAKVRLTRYIATHIDFTPVGELDDFDSAGKEDISALGRRTWPGFRFGHRGRLEQPA